MLHNYAMLEECDDDTVSCSHMHLTQADIEGRDIAGPLFLVFNQQHTSVDMQVELVNDMCCKICLATCISFFVCRI